MYWLQILEEALQRGEIVYITDGTYTTKVIDYEFEPFRIHLKTANNQVLTLDSADFFKGIGLARDKQDNTWYIAPDWWIKL